MTTPIDSTIHAFCAPGAEFNRENLDHATYLAQRAAQEATRLKKIREEASASLDAAVRSRKLADAALREATSAYWNACQAEKNGSML